MIRKSFAGSIIEAVRRINSRNILNWTSYRSDISAYSYVESAVKECKLPTHLIFEVAIHPKIMRLNLSKNCFGKATLD